MLILTNTPTAPVVSTLPLPFNNTLTVTLTVSLWYVFVVRLGRVGTVRDGTVVAANGKVSGVHRGVW